MVLVLSVQDTIFQSIVKKYFPVAYLLQSEK